MRIVFFGSPEFAIPNLIALHKHHNLVGVITQPDRPAGRGRTLRPSPVKSYAMQHDLAIIQPQKVKDPEVGTMIRQWEPDLAVVAAYGQILPASILDLAPHGFLNVHASLLPRWRGAAPAQAAILHGDTVTGVTIMLMDPGLDTGPILSQSKLDIKVNDTGGELLSRLSEVGADLLVETLPAYFAGEITPSPQDDNLATYAPRLKKTDGKISPLDSASQVARQVRAFEPWPGSYFNWKEKPILLRKSRALPQTEEDIGLIKALDGTPAICMKEGTLVLEELQPAGKNVMSGDAFLRGAQDFIGAHIDSS